MGKQLELFTKKQLKKMRDKANIGGVPPNPPEHAGEWGPGHRNGDQESAGKSLGMDSFPSLQSLFDGINMTPYDQIKKLE